MAASFAKDFDKNVRRCINHRSVFDELRHCVHYAVDPHYLFDAVERSERIANGRQHVDRS
jgi:hypothetical protein